MGPEESPLLVDRTAVAVPTEADIRTWMTGQRVFVSSVIDSLRAERDAVASTIDEIGAHAVRFEDFGGRDQDPQAAYLNEVKSSHIYLGLLGDRYGHMLRSGFSATHEEYHCAREQGLRNSPWVRESPDMDGHQRRFLDELRVFHVTGSFTTPDDLAAGVRRRLGELAAEALSPWCKLDRVIFRAESVTDRGAELVVVARVHSQDVAAALQAMARDSNGWRGGAEAQFTYSDRSLPVSVEAVETVTTAAAAREVKVKLRAREARSDVLGAGMSYRVGTSQYTPEDVTELAVRSTLFGEENPLGGFGFAAGIGDLVGVLRSLELSEEWVEGVARVLLTEELVGSGRAERLNEFRLGPPRAGRRRVRLAWVAPSRYTNLSPETRVVEGDMPV